MTCQKHDGTQDSHRWRKWGIPVKTNKWFWGLLVIGAGILLVLKAMGLGEEYDMFRIIGSLLLLGLAATGVPKVRFLLILIPLALIIYLWREPLGLAALNIYWLLGGAVLLGIGLTVLFHPRRPPWAGQSKDTAGGQYVYTGGRPAGGQDRTETILADNEFVSIDSSFGEHIRHLQGNNLRKVLINSNFASTRVYFDQCQVSSEGLEVAVSIHFSAVVLHVPRAWQVSNQISTFAGAVTDPGDAAPVANAPRLKLTGAVNFAEVKIIYI